MSANMSADISGDISAYRSANIHSTDVMTGILLNQNVENKPF